MLKKENNPNKETSLSNEAGQSIVIIALAFVALLAIVGLAVDVGFAYVRSGGFNRAVDAATQAAVVDYRPGSPDAANQRALQFLALNGWSENTLNEWSSSITYDRFGFPQYGFTATWSVETYFLQILGIAGFPITHGAQAAYRAQSELYTPTSSEDGQIRQATQFIIGKNGCGNLGDPVSPLNYSTSQGNPDYGFYNGVYSYRILVPSTYSESVVRVELFDPDTFNIGGDDVIVNHSFVGGNKIGNATTNTTCTPGIGLSCVLDTGESKQAFNENPFWFRRVDENYDANCNKDSNDFSGEDVTKFELYYLDENNNRIMLGQFISNSSNAASTDLRWISPGGSDPNDDVSADSGSFEIDMDAVDIPEETFGAKFIYLDVISESGTAKNVWDLWAGPATDFYDVQLDDDVNARNLQLADSPIAYGPGVSTFALGRMPLNYYLNESTTLKIAPIDILFGGRLLFLSHFGYNPSSPPPVINFTIDQASSVLYYDAAVGIPSSDGITRYCDGGVNCQTAWAYPFYTIQIPGEADGFIGGDLNATFNPGADSHTLSVWIADGRAFLTQ